MKSLLDNLKEAVAMNPMELLGKETPEDARMRDVNNFIAYAEKEGFISDAESWSDEEKLDYFNQSEAYDYKD